MSDSHHTGNSPSAERLTLPELGAKRQRGERIVMEVCQVSREDARRLIDGAGGSVKTAIVMQKLGLSLADAERALAGAGGVIRRVVHEPPPSVE